MMIDTQKLTLGIPRGSLSKNVQNLLTRAGMRITLSHPRQMAAAVDHPLFTQVVWASPRDIPEYLASGIVDVGLTGTDCFEEWELGQPNDFAIQALAASLRFSKQTNQSSKLCLLTKSGNKKSPGPGQRILTEFPHITKHAYPLAKPVPARGAIEGLIAAGRFEYGVTIVETGSSVLANGLEVLTVLKESVPELYCTSDAWLMHFDGEGPLFDFCKTLQVQSCFEE